LGGWAMVKMGGRPVGWMGDGERSGQPARHSPLDERDGRCPQGWPARRPGVQVRLVHRAECQLLLIEPGQDSGSGPDVVGVSLVGGVGVAAAGGPAPGVAQHVPFGERSDQGQLRRRKRDERAGDPVGEQGEVLVASGEDPGHDEQAAQVSGRRVLRQSVDSVVGEAVRLAGRAGRLAAPPGLVPIPASGSGCRRWSVRPPAGRAGRGQPARRRATGRSLESRACSAGRCRRASGRWAGRIYGTQALASRLRCR
jgi:hypothetical protein